MDEKEQLEQRMLEVLTEGEFIRNEPKQAAQKQLPPRYEMRIQTEHDPIVEETHLVRKMAQEVDDRYDNYLSRIPKHNREQ